MSPSQFKPALGRPTPLATVSLHGEVVHLRPVTANDAARLTEILRLAVPTREYQPGGPPIHAAPTWSWPTSAFPPPAGHLEADAPSEHQELLTGGSPVDGAVPYQKIKRVEHGFRNFTNYRLRLLLHCGVRCHTHRTARLRGRSPHLVA